MRCLWLQPTSRAILPMGAAPPVSRRRCHAQATSRDGRGPSSRRRSRNWSTSVNRASQLGASRTCSASRWASRRSRSSDPRCAPRSGPWAAPGACRPPGAPATRSGRPARRRPRPRGSRHGRPWRTRAGAPAILDLDDQRHRHRRRQHQMVPDLVAEAGVVAVDQRPQLGVRGPAGPGRAVAFGLDGRVVPYARGTPHARGEFRPSRGRSRVRTVSTMTTSAMLWPMRWPGTASG
jgi:hypothetical protein